MCRKILLLTIILILGCSKNREVVREEPKSDLTIGVSLALEESLSRATSYTDIHIQIFASSGDKIVDTVVATESELTLVTIPGIVEGVNYSALVWSEAESGEVIHSPVSKQFDITANEQTSLTFVLTPRCGSILFQLVDIPTRVDSLYLWFNADSGSYSTVEKRSKTVFLTLDKIPYGASGTLQFEMRDDEGEVISDWDTLFTYTDQDFSAEFSLINNGSLLTDITLENPASSIFTASGDTTTTFESETGTLLISEFCATGGSSSSSKEFVEFYNPAETSITLDTLFIEVGTKRFSISPFSLSGKSYYAISATAGTFWGCDTTFSLDITSTASLLRLRSNSEVLDYLLFFNDEDAGWEKLSSSAHQSWVLDSDKLSASANNSGSSWHSALSEVTDSEGDIWYGSPGRAGR
jgi:hypothetical protein